MERVDPAMALPNRQILNPPSLTLDRQAARISEEARHHARGAHRLTVLRRLSANSLQGWQPARWVSISWQASGGSSRF